MQIVDWEVSVAIISDRDSKFMSNFWKTTFKKLRMSLLISITYYSQTNEQFERINQMIEIAIRFLLSSIKDSLWPSLLSTLQVVFNNLKSITEYLSNQIIYEFKTKKVSNLIQSLENSNLDFMTQRFIYRFKVTNVITFVVSKAKAWYDKNYKLMILDKNSFVFLWSHHDYYLSDHLFRKLLQQYYESFQVQRRVDKLANKLKLSAHWRIHFIISIA